MYIFTSLEIALSKKFEKNALDNLEFTNWLFLFAIDKIYLVDQWEKTFCPLYTKIEKIQKEIPHDVSLLGISAILSKQAQNNILEKTRFKLSYCLMQTSLDQLKRI